MDGIRNISVVRKRRKSPLRIEIQVLVNKFNEYQIPAMRKLADGINASLKLKSMQIISKNNFESWLPSGKKFSRYFVRDGKIKIKSSLPDRCARLWFNPVITWDGKVLPCCFDKDAEHIMGDLSQETFSEIWNGTKFRLFRRVLLSDRSSIEICRNCTSGLKRWII